MEQLINAAKIPCCMSIILIALGTVFLVPIPIFIVEGTEDTKKRIKIIIALFIVGMPLLASGFYCKGIYDKYNNQAKSIVKNVIAKEYPDATEFGFELDEGYFVENGIDYEFLMRSRVFRWNTGPKTMINLNAIISTKMASCKKQVFHMRKDIYTNTIIIKL